MSGIVLAGVAAARLLAHQRSASDALRDQQHVVEVERQVPSGVELPVAFDGDTGCARP